MVEWAGFEPARASRSLGFTVRRHRQFGHHSTLMPGVGICTLHARQLGLRTSTALYREAHGRERLPPRYSCLASTYSATLAKTFCS